MALVKKVQELDVYQLAYKSMMEIFHLTKGFPIEERFDLTSQIRRSSRSVVANLLESWRRRRYPKNFVSKLNDSETEADETILWLNVSKDCNYISQDEFDDLNDKYNHILAMLVNMLRNPDRWKV